MGSYSYFRYGAQPRRHVVLDRYGLSFDEPLHAPRARIAAMEGAQFSQILCIRAQAPIVVTQIVDPGRQVDYREGTITLPCGDSYPVQQVRGMRWVDYARSGSYRAIIDIDDLARPIHPVGFSTPAGPEAFVARLRTAIEKAGGPRFSVAANDRMEIVERDLSDPVTAAIATRVRPLGRRVSYSRVD